MSRMSLSLKIGGIVIALSLVLPVGSWAQNSALEEIVVTAQKREQSLQDVSISVSAFSGDTVDDFGFEDTRDIFYQIPNVDVSQFSFSSSITIRGNPTLNSSLAGEGNVTLYFDEVYRATVSGGGQEMLDVDRVEVLRGPQGTLFGRNSTAGLVHFISRKPTEELEGYVNVEFGSYDTRVFEGAVSGPLSDRVRGRVAVKYHEDNGFQRNQGPAGGRLAVIDRLVGRAHLDIDLSENTNLLLSVEASDLDDIGQAFNYWGLLDPVTFEQCDAARIRAGQCVGLGGFGDPDLDVERPFTEHDPGNGDGAYTLETLSATARLSWQLSDTTELVSITAFDSHDRFFNTDEDASAVGPFGGAFQYNDFYTSDSDQITQELRLSGGNDGTDWLLGFYYFDEDRGSTSTVRDFETVQAPGTIVELNTESVSVFGEFGKSLSDTVRLIGGLRYTDEEKKTDVLTETIPGSQQLSADNVSGKLGLEWRPRDEWMVYGTVSSGFRSGNFNTDLLFGDLTALTAVDPEEVVSFELGSKSTLLDGRMRLNAALSFQDVTDKQGITYDSVGTPVSRLISVGDAEILAAELELYLVPTDNLEFTFGLGWLDSEVQAPEGFGSFFGWGTGANAGVGDFLPFDGSEVHGADWSFNGVVRYHLPLADSGSLTLQADYDWRDEITGGRDGDEITYSEDRILVNLRVFWRSPSERFDVQAYVENAFDEKYIDNTFALAGHDYAYGNMGMPQWYGVKFGMSF